MSKRSVKWLYEELPLLVKEGVISEDVSKRIRDFYGDSDRRGGRRMALAVFGVFGAALIGAGIILLLAHNWGELSRPARAVLSFVPLVASQLAALWVIWKEKTSAAWREGTATFAMLSIAASIALVGQTYHIPGDLEDFLLTCMLLTIPLVYVMDASVPAALYLFGIASWAGFVKAHHGEPFLFWGLAALFAPHVWLTYRKDAYSLRSVWLCWAVALCLPVAVGISAADILDGLWIVVFTATFALLYLAGDLWFGEAPSGWRQPFRSVGALGVVVLSLILTYEFPWRDIGRHYRDFSQVGANWPDYVTAGSVVVAAICLLVMTAWRGRWISAVVGMAPAVAMIGYSAWSRVPWVAMTLFNVYLFGLGLVTLVFGIRRMRLGTINCGMLILAGVIAARFFDSHLGFTLKGVAFILIGAAFLTTNIVLVKRMKGGAR